MEHIQPPRAPKRGILWQVFTLVSPGLINQREKTGGAVCLNPGDDDKKSEWSGRSPACLPESTTQTIVPNMSTQTLTHTHSVLPQVGLELSTSMLVFPFYSPIFHPSDVAFK